MLKKRDLIKSIMIPGIEYTASELAYLTGFTPQEVGGLLKGEPGIDHIYFFPRKANKRKLYRRMF